MLKLYLNLNHFYICPFTFVSVIGILNMSIFQKRDSCKYIAEMMRQGGVGGKITSPKDRKIYGD